MKKFFKYSFVIGLIGAVVNLILFVTNLFYELVVPVIENSSLEEGPVFDFFDNLIYFTPCIFMVLFVLYIVAGIIYKKKFHEKNEEKETEKLVEKNTAIQKELDVKAEFLNHKYYTNCPSCGSVRVENTSVCSFCGASLVINDNVSIKPEKRE